MERLQRGLGLLVAIFSEGSNGERPQKESRGTPFRQTRELVPGFLNLKWRTLAKWVPLVRHSRPPAGERRPDSFGDSLFSVRRPGNSERGRIAGVLMLGPGARLLGVNRNLV